MKPITKICPICGEKYSGAYWYISKRKFCSTKCATQYNKENRITGGQFERGHIPNNKGKKLDELYDADRAQEIRDIISAITKGRPSGNKGKKYPYKARPHCRKEKVIIECLNPTNNPKCSGVVLSRGSSFCQSCSLLGHIPWNKGLTKEDAPSLSITEETKMKISRSNMGRECSKETRAKIAESNKGKIVSEETRRKIGDISRGRKVSEETKRKLSEIGRARGENHPNKRPEVRKKLREGAIRRIERQHFSGMPLNPAMGINEKPFLDKIEFLLGKEIKRQYRVCGYFLDGYCPDLNMAFEIDEPYHEKHKEKDATRQNEIEKELECSFVRIDVT